MKCTFGPFTLDTDTRQLLTRRGEEIRVSPKAFELLVALVETRPKALSKADLQTRLWPDTFVSDNNLPTLIKEIRRALGEDARTPTYIRTLHGYGYAFNGAGDPRRSAEADADSTFWLIADRPIRLREGENLLGRDPDATVWFDRTGVSRQHARIIVAGGQATIEDLGSRNGTRVGGKPATGPMPLHDGDEVRLGTLTVTFQVRRAAATTEAVLPDDH